MGAAPALRASSRRYVTKLNARIGTLALSVTGVIVSAASVTVLMRIVPPVQIGAALRAADVRWVGVIVLLYVASYPVRSYRWAVLLEPAVRLRQVDVLSAQAVGLLGNTFLPAHAGDVGRGLLIGRKTGLGSVTTLASIVAERMLDVAANLFIAAVLAIVVGLPQLSALWAGRIQILILGGVGGVIAAAAMSGLAWRVLRRQPQSSRLHTRGALWLMQFSRAVAAGFQVFSDRRALSMAAMLSLVLWGLLGLTNYFAMLAVGSQLPMHAAFVVLVAQTAGVAIPSSPAYIGTFHMATVLALSLYGMDPAASLSLAVITHAVGVIVAVAIGVPCLWYEGLSARGLCRAARRPITEVA